MKLWSTLFCWLFLIQVPVPGQVVKIPSRIVSLGPMITEAIYVLGVEDRLCACTNYCIRPPEARHKKKIGSVTQINLEEIVSLRPDLVLTIGLTDPKTTQKMKNLGIKVITFPQPAGFDDLCRQFQELGRITGKEALANTIVTQTRTEVSAIRSQIQGKPKPRVFFQLGSNPLFAVSRESFTNDYILFAGGINIAEDAGIGIFSREKVLSRNPQVIIIVSMGIAGEKEKKVWQTYPSLEAVKQNRIFIVDSYQFCSPTPPRFVEALREMVQYLHPEPKPNHSQSRTNDAKLINTGKPQKTQSEIRK